MHVSMYLLHVRTCTKHVCVCCVCLYFDVWSINLGQRPSSKSYAKRVVHLLIRAHQNFQMYNLEGMHMYQYVSALVCMHIL